MQSNPRIVVNLRHIYNNHIGGTYIMCHIGSGTCCWLALVANRSNTSHLHGMVAASPADSHLPSRLVTRRVAPHSEPGLPPRGAMPILPPAPLSTRRLQPLGTVATLRGDSVPVLCWLHSACTLVLLQERPATLSSIEFTFFFTDFYRFFGLSCENRVLSADLRSR